MRSKVLLLAVSAALLAVLPSAAFGRASHASVNSQTYTDSTGEDPNAPDITSIAVSNDDAGLITFKVNISNRPTLTPDMTVLLFLDTDQKATTGDPQSLGADYVIELDPGAVGLFQWNGSDYVAAASQTSLTFATTRPARRSGRAPAIWARRRASTSPRSRSPGSRPTRAGTPTSRTRIDDIAPDAGHGFYNYKVHHEADAQRRGVHDLARSRRNRARTSRRPRRERERHERPGHGGNHACNATVGGEAHHAARRSRVTNGIAVCLWQLPKTSKGKTIRGTVTLTVQGVKVTRSFTAKIT